MVQLLISEICFAGCENTHSDGTPAQMFTDKLIVWRFIHGVFAHIRYRPSSLSGSLPEGYRQIRQIWENVKTQLKIYMYKKGPLFLYILMHKTMIWYLEPHQKIKLYKHSAFNHFRDVVYTLWFTPDWQVHRRTKKFD